MNPNADEAQKAFETAELMIRQHNFVRAIKLLEISQRLRPSQVTLALLNDTKSRLTPRAENTNAGNVGNGSEGISLSANAQFSISSSVLSPIFKYINDLECRYIIPSIRPYLRTIVIIFVTLLVYKILFKKDISFGVLPGDFHYASKNIHIHAPIVSCLLFSFLVNALMRTFQN
mmetsp:Transcript_9817/g.9915  ORF Transcript_9817/g.9915 Transcript_9817/m.9915 type:complete len:174 (-) Transcript_9817:100-621(-)